MKRLSVQVQPDLVSDVELNDVVASLEQLTQMPPDVQEDAGKDGRYINLNFVTSDVRQLWEAIESKLALPLEPLSRASKGIIVVCEGKHGWSDYLLLYHFDKRKKLDTLED